MIREWSGVMQSFDQFVCATCAMVFKAEFCAGSCAFWCFFCGGVISRLVAQRSCVQNIVCLKTALFPITTLFFESSHLCWTTHAFENLGFICSALGLGALHSKLWRQFLPSKRDNVWDYLIFNRKHTKHYCLSLCCLTSRSGLLPSHITFCVPIYQCAWVAMFWTHHLLRSMLSRAFNILCAPRSRNLEWIPTGWAEIRELLCKYSR